MPYILHDISVCLWAWRTNHSEWKDCKVAIRWPISICKAQPTYERTWLVQLRSPKLYVLNSYRAELDYLLARSSDTATD